MGVDNEKICNEIKRIVYAGVGAAVAATEVVNDLFNKLSDKGEEFINKKNPSAGPATGNQNPDEPNSDTF